MNTDDLIINILSYKKKSAHTLHFPVYNFLTYVNYFLFLCSLTLLVSQVSDFVGLPLTVVCATAGASPIAMWSHVDKINLKVVGNNSTFYNGGGSSWWGISFGYILNGLPSLFFIQYLLSFAKTFCICSFTELFQAHWHVTCPFHHPM